MRWLARLAVLGAAVALAALAGAAWLLGTEAGLRWAVARAVAAAGGRLAAEGARGALASSVSIERLAYHTDSVSLEAREIRGRADLLAVLAGRVALDPLEASSLVLELEDGRAAGKARAPDVLPFGVSLANVALERVELRRAGVREILRELRLEYARLDGREGSLSGSVRRPDERFPAQAAFEVRGALERIELSAKVEVPGIAGELRALVLPFVEHPLQAIEARAAPFDLSRFDPALPATAITLHLRGEATARLAMAGSLAATNAIPGPLDKARAPVSSVRTRFAAADFGSARLEALRIALAGGGALEGHGTLSGEGLRAELRASGIDLRAIRSTLRRSSLQGPLQVVLARERQSVGGRLAQEGLSVAAEVLRAGDTIDIRGLRAAAQGGELTGAARLRLGEALAFDARLALAAFDPAAFGDYPQGSVNASIAAAGRLGKSPELDATWTVSESSLLGHALESRGSAHLAGKRMTRAKAHGRLGGARASVQGDFGGAGDELAWRLEVPQLGAFAEEVAGPLEASGTLSGTWERPELAATAHARELRLAGRTTLRSASITLRGGLASHELALSASAPDVDVRARLRGGWRGGEGWSGELQALTNAGDYPLRLVRPAPLALSRERFALGRVEAVLGEGRLLVHEASWASGRIASRGEFTGLPAQWLVLAAGLAERLRATLLLDGDWSLVAAPRLEGTLSARRASGELSILGDEPIALELGEATLEGRFTGGHLAARAALTSRFGRMSLEGELAPAADSPGPGIGARSPVSFRAQMDFAAIRVLAQPYLDEARLDGRLRAEIEGGGTLGALALTGALRGEAISLDVPPYGVFLRNGELRAVLEGDALRIEKLSIDGGRGRFTASGALPLRLAGGTLSWQARNFTVVERPDLLLVASGRGKAAFDGKRLSLAGELRAERGRLELQRERLPQLGDDVVVLGRPSAAAAERVRLPIALDLVVDLGRDLAVRGQGLEGRLAGRLQVLTTGQGELRAYGELRTVNATYLAYGQLLEVDPGVLTFDGPIDNPSLQVTAWRRNQAVEAGVQISGTARSPTVELVSKPPVPEGEQLSWLVLGRAPSEATQADLGLLQAAAGALLSRDETMPLDRRLARSVGLDELTLRGTGEVQDRVVAFGKRLSERAYVSYERGLGAAATSLVKLDYALSQHWSLRAETGSTTSGSPTSGAGVFYRFSWD